MENESDWKNIVSAVKAEEWDDAISRIDSLIKKEPADPEHFIRIGDLYLNETKIREAVRAYRSALDLYKKAGALDRAIMACMKILAVDPDNRVVQIEMDGLLKLHAKNRMIKVKIGKPANQEPAKTDGKTFAVTFLKSDMAPEFLRGLEETEIARLSELAAPRNFRAGERIVGEGEQGDSVFVLMLGTVEVSIAAGGRKLVLAELSEGDFFGEMSFLTSKPRTSTVTASTDAYILELGRTLLDGLIEKRPLTLKYLYNVYTTRMDVTLNRLKNPDDKLSGQLGELPLPDLLQVFEHSRKEGEISVVSGEASGIIGVKDGRITSISFGSRFGEDALVEMLSLDCGAFSYLPSKIESGPQDRPIGFMLMEAIRMMDEKSSLSDCLPSEDRVLTMLEDRAHEDADMNAVLNAVGSGESTLSEIRRVTGLSHTRAALAAAKLIKKGAVKSA